jgi:hypothetical protein
MNGTLPIWANIAQVISLPIAILALILQAMAYFSPNPPTKQINQFITKIRPALPYVFLTAISFWLGTTITSFSEDRNSNMPNEIQDTKIALEQTNVAQKEMISAMQTDITKIETITPQLIEVTREVRVEATREI